MKAHALTGSKLLRRYEPGPANLGLGSRRKGDRVLVAVWSKTSGARFAGYIERDGRLTDSRIVEGVRAGADFLEGSDAS